MRLTVMKKISDPYNVTHTCYFAVVARFT